MDAELRKAAGEEGTENEEGEPTPQLLIPPLFPTAPSTSPSFTEEKRPSSAQLVTAHGTYATQSAFTATPLQKEEKM